MASKSKHPCDETSRIVASSQNSETKVDAVTPESLLSDYLEVDGKGNQLGVNSSCDSLSRNTQNKLTVSSSATQDASAVVEMLPKVSSSGYVEDQLTSKGDQKPTAKPSFRRDSSDVFPSVDADRSVGTDPNMKVDSEKDCVEPRDKILKCSDDDEKVEKSKKLADCFDTQNPRMHFASNDANDDSDSLEQDVKVCDICGDAGREDLLAVCSMCSDGAEHTYCMREMLQKVPDGDWLCEECKMAEETEMQKQETEGKRANETYFGTRGSGKRPAEDLEPPPASKKQAMEAGNGLSPSKVGILTWDNSFTHTDKRKERPSHQVLTGNHISKISTDGGHSPRMDRQINPTNGKLSKSSLFNATSKPKVKPMDDVPHKQKGSREHILPEKEGIVRVMGKSMSFKSANSDWQNSTEPKVKSLSSKTVQEMKGLISPKDSSFERKRLPRLDRSLIDSSKSSASVSTCKTEQKLTPRGEAAFHSFASNSRGSMFVHSNSKLCLSKLTSPTTQKLSDAVSTPVGASSTCGISASVEKRLNKNNQDEPSSSSSWNSDKVVNNGDRKTHDGLRQSQESSHVDKCRDNTSRRSKQSGTSLGSVACQGSKDVGHDVESCSLSSPRAGGFASSTVRSSGEDLNGNKLKAAITAAMLKKPGIYRRRQLEKSNDLPMSNVEMRSAAPSHDNLSLHKIISTDVQETGKVSEGCRSETHNVVDINNAKQLDGQPDETSLSSKMTDSDSIVCFNGKPVTRDVHLYTSAVPLVHLKLSTIPEHGYIWQGGFQVCRGGKLPELCDGIQAHLSASASPKVAEAVDKFPRKILFDELPRLSTWPSQFNTSGPKDDNIALYFFAKDIESYERNYKSLLENMIKKDLALRGEINGVELLIFPSNWLPENTQRWNMLFFLWGVFRGRRMIGMDQTSDSKNLPIPCVNVVHSDKKLPGAIFSYSESVSSLQSKDEDLQHDTAVDAILARESFSSAQRPKLSSLSGTEGGSDPKTSLNDQKNKSLDTVLRHSTPGTPSLPEFLSGSVLSHPGIEHTKKTMNDIDVQEHERYTQFQQFVEPPGTSDSSRLEMVHRVKHDDIKDSLCHPATVFLVDIGEVQIGAGRTDAEDEIVDLKEDKKLIQKDDLVKDLKLMVSDNQQKKRKYMHSVLETNLQASIGTSQTVQWKDRYDAMVEGQGAGKKMKSEISGSNNSRTRTIVSDQASTFLVEDKFGKACEVKCASNDVGTTERHFFPLDSALGDGLQFGDDSKPWKVRESENERSIGGFPNLELALGADTKALNKGNQSFISSVPGTGDMNQDTAQDKVLAKEEEDVSASLSLSLSFPFPEKEQAVKPIMKSEQSQQERHHVNTSLLLFGDPREK